MHTPEVVGETLVLQRVWPHSSLISLPCKPCVGCLTTWQVTSLRVRSTRGRQDRSHGLCKAAYQKRYLITSAVSCALEAGHSLQFPLSGRITEMQGPDVKLWIAQATISKDTQLV